MKSFMLTIQSSKSRFVYLLMFELKQDSLGDVILLTSQGVSFTEVQEGLITTVYTNSEQCTIVWLHDIVEYVRSDNSIIIPRNVGPRK